MSKILNTAVLLMALTGFLVSQQKRILMKDGFAAFFPAPENKCYVKEVADISSRSGRIDFTDQTRTTFTDVWMINYIDNQWRFPEEIKAQHKKLDTIFLRDGTYFHDLVMDYSSRRHVYEFKNHKPLHWSKIRRIYIAQKIKFR